MIIRRGEAELTEATPVAAIEPARDLHPVAATEPPTEPHPIAATQPAPEPRSAATTGSLSESQSTVPIMGHLNPDSTVAADASPALHPSAAHAAVSETHTRTAPAPASELPSTEAGPASLPAEARLTVPSLQPPSPRSDTATPERNANAPPIVDPRQLAIMLRRGEALLAIGDVSGARRFFERAAASGSAAAAKAIAETYDPYLLETQRAGGRSPDHAAALAWYRLAAALGAAREVAPAIARLEAAR